MRVNFADVLIRSYSRASRAVPYFRGLGRLSRAVNRAALRIGANPVVIADMRDGTKICVDLRSNTEFSAYYLGQYDGQLIDTLNALLDLSNNSVGNKVFIDVGANIGFYTIAIAQHLRNQTTKAKIYSFEPHPANLERFNENIELNDLHDMVESFNFGLSDASCLCDLTLREDFQNGAGTGNASIPSGAALDEGFPKISIKLEPLDKILVEANFNISGIDAIKIDIEGHEDYFLRGAVNTIRKFRPVIMLEINKPYYRARGVGLDKTFLPIFPDRYLIFTRSATSWRKIITLESCSEIDNIFLLPCELVNRMGLG